MISTVCQDDHHCPIIRCRYCNRMRSSHRLVAGILERKETAVGPGGFEMFTLHIGCHRGTLISRDSESRKFDTLKDAIESYEKSKSSWEMIGYTVWFAYIKNEDGDTIWTGESNSYR